MLFSPQPNLRHSYGGLSLVALMLIPFCVTGASGQIGGIDSDPGDRGTGGRNTVQGTIFLPGGRRLDRRAKVTLVSVGGGQQFKMSDDNGAFTFWRLRGGTYTLTVDAGNEFDIATETVDIIVPMQRRNDPGTTHTVYITLQPKRSDSTMKPGTVDATTAGAPEAARKLYTDALESAHAGDSKKAIEQLNEAVRLYPNFMTALNELGVQYMSLKDWRKAAEALRTAIKLGPEAFHPRLNYGIVLMQMKDYKAAAAELQVAVQKDSSSAVAQFQLGRSLVNLGNYDAAESALKRSISIAGEENAEAHRYLGAVYIEKHDNTSAANELDAYVKLAPKAKDADKIRAIIKDLRAQASAKPR